MEKFRRIVVSLVVIGLLTGAGIRTARSYFRTAQAVLSHEIRDLVPVNFELERFKQVVKDLMPEIRANQHAAAELEVELDYLKRGIDAQRSSQLARRQEMDVIRKALEKGGDSYAFDGKTYSLADVQTDLGKRLQRFKETEQELNAKERLMEAKRRSLNAATAKIATYQKQRDMLDEKAEALRSDLKLAEAAQAGGAFEFDDSKMAEAQQLAQEVEKRVLTIQKIMEQEHRVDEEIPVVVDTRSITDQFDKYFNSQRLANK